MNIIIVDDESLLLKYMTKIVSKIKPEDHIYGFNNSLETVKFAQENKIDVAFLDIQMPGLTGIDLAKKLQETNPKINVIFTTGYDDYALDAFKINASSYILKPITQEAIEKAFENLRYSNQSENNQPSAIKFKCFGNFECFCNNIPIEFNLSKTKELLAYLVYKNGSLCSNEEIISIIWEDDKDHLSYFKQMRQDLDKTFTKLNCENVLVRQRGKIGIRTDIVSCDFYDYLQGKPIKLKEFMTQYSWAEDFAGLIQSDNKYL